jgi:hypothetical protein
MNYGPPEAWGGVVPMRGSLAFDFVSAASIPEGAAAIGECGRALALRVVCSNARVMMHVQLCLPRHHR